MNTFRVVTLVAVFVAVTATTPLIAQRQDQALRPSGQSSHMGHIGPTAKPSLLKHVTDSPLPAGTYTVGAGGAFATLDSVFERLAAGGILGPVTFLLTDASYVASPSRNGIFYLQGPIAGAGPGSRVTIRPSDNVAATISGNGEAVLWFDHVSYLTLDGISLEGNTRLKVHSVYSPAAAFSDAIALVGNCDYVVIQNLTAFSEDNRKSWVIDIYADSTDSAPDSCQVSGVFVPAGYQGIYVGGLGSLSRPRGCIIRGNRIGSVSDSLISRGIQVELADYTIIEGNHVENIRAGYPAPGVTGDWNYALGINAYFTRNTIIRNNVVHNICATMSETFIDGILLSGWTSERGAKVWVYNNMVYDIRTRVIQNVDMNGIGAWDQDSLRVDFNSVYLSYKEGTRAEIGSSSLGFYSTVSLPSARNNILVNDRNDSPDPSLAIWFGGTGGLSDFNDLYVGPYDSSFVAWYGSASYKSLTDLQSAGKETHSVSVMPPFVSSEDLHISNTSTPLADAATPLAGIAEDFEGDPRPRSGDSAPDIGADEFQHTPVGIDGVNLVRRSFALEQNYPNPFNPLTIIKYTVGGNRGSGIGVSDVSLVVYDVLGREVAVLVNERKPAGRYEVTFDGSGLASGVYIYRLVAGTFVQSGTMILLK